MSALGWDWVERCLVCGGTPTLELHDEAVAAGAAALPVIGRVLARREWRSGDSVAEAFVSLHALRLLGIIGEPAAIPMLASVLRDPRDPARHGEEAALALARVGGDALPILERVLVDRSEDTWVRGCAARGLMHAALRDRKAKKRALAAYERLLRDPAETDATLGALIVDAIRVLHAGALLPAIFEAWMGGRIDREFIAWPDLEIELTSRRARSDWGEHALTKRDPREEYTTEAQFLEQLDEDAARELSAVLERLRREGADEPPETGPA